MQTLTEKLWKLQPPGGLFDEAVILACFPTASSAARRNLLHRATLAGEVSILRRGLYLLAPPMCRHPIEPLAFPPLLYGPSYVSFETALRYHGLIPDVVQTVAAATCRRSRTFETILGRFDFIRVPVRMLMAGVRLETFELDGRQVFGHIASPARAMADLAYIHKKVAAQADIECMLAESWRIDLDEVADIVQPKDIEDSMATYRNTRVQRFLERLIDLLTPSSPS